ncbi:MAG: phosphate/phosphite/phosphonate ABC transporter substrate-binding protein [Acidiferrobacter sp.]
MRRYIVAIIMSLACVTAGAEIKPLTYTFIAPPRQGPAAAQAIYGTIAQFLSRATGAPIVFRYTSNWLTYMNDVRTNKADIYFDGPSFIGWRIARWHDKVAVALSGSLNFVVVAKVGGPAIPHIKDLVGRSICAFSPPNLGTLTLDSWFRNPERQPYTIVIHNFVDGIHKILAGKCVAAIEPLPVYKHMVAQFPGQLRVIYKAPPLPNQGFSISATVPRALRHKIIAALLSPAGRVATKPLRDMFGHKDLVAVQDSAYLPDRKLLDVMVGF